MIKCPNCEKQIDGEEIKNKSKIAYQFGNTIGIIYECDCGESIMLETTPLHYYGGRNFLEFNNKK